MSSDILLSSFRGELKAISGIENIVYFVTQHKEGYATPLYILDPQKKILFEAALPAGGLTLAEDSKHVWVSGADKILYRYNKNKEAIYPVGKEFSSAIKHIALLSNDRLALTFETSLLIVNQSNASPIQTLALAARPGALAVDPTGNWLAVGDESGFITVYEAETQSDYVLSDRQKFHNGAVTALLFEPAELRFFSAGTDTTLNLIHARGKLDVEDKAKSWGHKDTITSMVIGHFGDDILAGKLPRLYTGGKDKTIKAWPIDSMLQPGSYKDGVGKVSGLCLTKIDQIPYIVAICESKTVQLYRVDESLKLESKKCEYKDAYTWAKSDCGKKGSAEDCEKSLLRMAQFDDIQAINIISDSINNKSDTDLRRSAAKLLSDSKNVKAPLLLKKSLCNKDEKVRDIIFDGLIKFNGEQDYLVLEEALNSGYTNIAHKAIQLLVKNASTDRRAINYLVFALNIKPYEVRSKALQALEQVGQNNKGVDQTETVSYFLNALDSKHEDLRKLALIHLYQKNYLQQPRVGSALRMMLGDTSLDVRRCAFYVTLFLSPDLANFLRASDENINRELDEIEQYGKPRTKPRKESLLKSPLDISFDDSQLQPLLQAIACRNTDISILGVNGLAILKDARAFALLVQLSRDETATIRIEVSRAFGALANEQSVNCLCVMLDDSEIEVRVSAFNALENVYSELPLAAVKAGFDASAEDIHQRALQLLIGQYQLYKEKLPPEIENGLLGALNDSFVSVRQEAFKTILNNQIATDKIKTLEFLLQSVQMDIRKGVLTELMAQYRQDWAKDRIPEFFNDKNASLREQAYTYLVSKTKNRDFTIVTLALRSQYENIRLAAVRTLISIGNSHADNLLSEVIKDKDRTVRQLALDTLVGRGASELLKTALTCEHLDIRVRVATALAKQGDAAAAAPLLEILRLVEPKETKALAEWQDAIVNALYGLGEIDDDSPIELVHTFIKHSDKKIRHASINCLIWLTKPKESKLLTSLLKHQDPYISKQAAYGLAYCGDTQAQALIFNSNNRQVSIQDIAAALVFEDEAIQILTNYLDSDDSQLNVITLRCLLLLDACSSKEPKFCIRALSSRFTWVRFIATEALKFYQNRVAYIEYITQWINEARSAKAWKIQADVINQLANLLANGDNKLKVRTVLLFKSLDAEKQSEWDFAWNNFVDRFRPQVEVANAIPFDGSQRQTYSELAPLVFGTYIGLARESGADSSGNANIRLKALKQLTLLSSHDTGSKVAYQSVLLQSLNDTESVVRILAFESLLESGMDLTTVCAEALSVKRADVGKKALQTLIEKEEPRKATQLLTQVMMVNTDGLELEAAILLAESGDTVSVMTKAMDSDSERMRIKAVNVLESKYEPASDVRVALINALKNRYLDVRIEVCYALSRKKDDIAATALIELLQSPEAVNEQASIVKLLLESNRPKVTDVLLSMLENNQQGHIQPKFIFYVVSGYKNRKDTDRLFKLARDADYFNLAVKSLLKISGYDQSLEDPDDAFNDKSWIDKQHPRDDKLLAEILAILVSSNNIRKINELLPCIRWSPSNAVDSELANLVHHTNIDLSKKIIEAVGWRVKNRNMTAEPLLRVLERADTQFDAAAALACAGNDSGFNVLLTALKHSDDYDVRIVAVHALGRLGDDKALELLLEHAKNSGSYLQNYAAEAIGHMAKSDYAHEIFELLKKYTEESYELGESALTGLRWFNTEDAWRIIRQKAIKSNVYHEDEAIRLLAYNPVDETREVLLQAIRNADDDNQYLLDEAYDSARQIFNQNDLRPEFAILENRKVMKYSYASYQPQLAKVCKEANTDDILSSLSRCVESVQKELELTLMKRKSLKIRDLLSTLLGDDPIAAGIAARLSGNIGSLDVSERVEIEKALQHWLNRWEIVRNKTSMSNAAIKSVDRLPKQNLGKIATCLARLCWVAGHYKIAEECLIDTAKRHQNDRKFSEIRVQTLLALQAFPNSEKITKIASELLGNADTTIRTVAIEILLQQDPDMTSLNLNDLMSDQASVRVLADSGDANLYKTIRESAANSHHQGISLPIIIRDRDIKGLGEIANNAQYDDETRLGAIEGLARVMDKDSEQELVSLAQQLQTNEDLRKAAWNGLRRLKRARLKMMELQS